jgi:hypothetical protein
MGVGHCFSVTPEIFYLILVAIFCVTTLVSVNPCKGYLRLIFWVSPLQGGFRIMKEAGDGFNHECIFKVFSLQVQIHLSVLLYIWALEEII